MGWDGMADPRFDSYENRRIVHLLKLAMIVMASRARTEIILEDIIEAVSEVLRWFNDLDDGTKNLIIRIGLGATASRRKRRILFLC